MPPDLLYPSVERPRQVPRSQRGHGRYSAENVGEVQLVRNLQGLAWSRRPEQG